MLVMTATRLVVILEKSIYALRMGEAIGLVTSRTSVMGTDMNSSSKTPACSDPGRRHAGTKSNLLLRETQIAWPQFHALASAARSLELCRDVITNGGTLRSSLYVVLGITRQSVCVEFRTSIRLNRALKSKPARMTFA